MKLLTALGLSLALGAQPATAQSGEVSPGDVPSYTFRSPLLNGKGAKSLEDFRGKPVLVEFWGTK